MPFDFRCPHCQHKLEAENEWGGLDSQCPRCEKNLRIPMPSAIISSKIVNAITADPPPLKKQERHQIAKSRKMLYLWIGSLAVAIVVLVGSFHLLRQHRIAEVKRVAEEKRLAEEKRVAEAKRVAEEKRLAEAKRLAEEKRIAEVAAEKRLANEKRIADQLPGAFGIVFGKTFQNVIGEDIEVHPPVKSQNFEKYYISTTRSGLVYQIIARRNGAEWGAMLTMSQDIKEILIASIKMITEKYGIDPEIKGN